MATAPRAVSRVSASRNSASTGTVSGAAAGVEAAATAATRLGSALVGAVVAGAGVAGGAVCSAARSAGAPLPCRGAGAAADASRFQIASLMAVRTGAGTRWENIAIMGTTTMHAMSRAERILMVAPAVGGEG